MGQKFNIIISDDAHQDIDDIYEYIRAGLQNAKAADMIVDSIYEAISYLDTDPMIYPAVGKDGFRKCPVKNYIVLYRVYEKENKVVIAHVYHGTQNYLSEKRK